MQFATFPGFTPSHATHLPHGLETLDQMKRVTRAQAKLAAKVSLNAVVLRYWDGNGAVAIPSF